jgi:hypothetical protein
MISLWFCQSLLFLFRLASSETSRPVSGSLQITSLSSWVWQALAKLLDSSWVKGKISLFREEGDRITNLGLGLFFDMASELQPI